MSVEANDVKAQVATHSLQKLNEKELAQKQSRLDLRVYQTTCCRQHAVALQQGIAFRCYVKVVVRGNDM